MKSLKDELAKVLKGKDESAVAEALAKFCKKHADELPLPGQDSQFDMAMWQASEHQNLSKKDETILARVTGKLLGQETQASSLKLKDLVGAGKEAAIAAW